MVTKSKQTSKQEEVKGRIKVGNLKLNRETIKDLTGGEQKKIQGGARGTTAYSVLVACSEGTDCCETQTCTC